MVDCKPTKRNAHKDTSPNGPIVILVETSLAENIGMVARAMMNFGLTELRLVRPKCKWQSSKAINASSGAHTVIKNAKIFGKTEEAICDLHRVGATTARLRDMIKEVAGPRDWALTMRKAILNGEKCGVLFGAERSGLHNDEIALADTLVTLPTNPSFSSLNLAQSVLLVGYEWYTAAPLSLPKTIRRKGYGAVPASQEDIIAFYNHLENELDDSGFLRVQEKRPRMVRNIRNIFNRAKLTDQEVRTLRGIIAALSKENKQLD